jgi:ParB family chromosome partitioning protein
MLDMLLADIRRNGLFDAVVCDSVLNSVDTAEAENAVVTMLNAFCKMGGAVWVAGRDKEDTLAIYEGTRSAGSAKCRLVFLDGNGFHAQFRDGRWFYQKFHTERDLFELGERCGLARVPFPKRYKMNADTIHMHYTKTRVLPWEQVKEAAAFEFNMPVNKEGRRLGRHEDVIATLAEFQ